MAKKSKKSTDLDDVLSVLSDFQNMVATRFDDVDNRFDGVDSRSDKLEIELFRQGEEVNDIKADVKEIKQKGAATYSILDSHMKHIDDIFQENKMRDLQQERMERWIFQLADKMNVKLKYE